MKLFELYNITPQYAWFEPAPGPEGINGVRLAFLEPIKPKFDAHIADAKNKNDAKRAEQITLKKQNYLKQGYTHLVPDLGWWLSKEAFNSGENSSKGKTKGNVFKQYPNLKIYNSQTEALKAANKKT